MEVTLDISDELASQISPIKNSLSKIDPAGKAWVANRQKRIYRMP